ncbi:MAG TPA: pentapeptide repeat-containing protein [Sorangium sp.]|nr:pentapeptide repeat-containing protein [Sorangium sp.]
MAKKPPIAPASEDAAEDQVAPPAAPGRFRGATLAGADFDDVDLRGARFHNVALTKAELDDVDLRGARLHNATLAGASLDDISLAGARVDNADAAATRWSDVSLRRARFEESDLRDVEIVGCTIDGLTIDGVRIDRLLEEAKARSSASSAPEATGKATVPGKKKPRRPAPVR